MLDGDFEFHGGYFEHLHSTGKLRLYRIFTPIETVEHGVFDIGEEYDKNGNIIKLYEYTAFRTYIEALEFYRSCIAIEKMMEC